MLPPCCRREHGEVYAGTSGFGLMMPLEDADEKMAQDRVRARKETTVPHFPSPSKRPALRILKAMLDRVKSVSSNQTNAQGTNQPSAVYLGQDWRTLGDWTGRYGQQHAILSAMAAPMDHILGWGHNIDIYPRMGPHHDAGDSLRYWIGSKWITTSDPRGLYSTRCGNPPSGDMG